jgi:helix-turn-helix protein
VASSNLNVQLIIFYLVRFEIRPFRREKKVQFSLPGDDAWREGKLVLENGSLYFRSKEESKLFIIPFLRKGMKLDVFIPFLRKGKKSDFIIPVRNIRDVIREKTNTLIIKHTGNAKLPTQELGSESELLLSTHLAADEHVLNEVERELVLRMDANNFNVYFNHTGEGGALPVGKNVALEKGLLKIVTEALWIIGRESHKRIAWDDIVHVEQKKRNSSQGTEYGAISIEYFGEGNTNTSVISTTIITKGDTIEILKRHALELLNAYKIEEKLSEMENRILRTMYAGALDLSSSQLASTAAAVGLSEEELKNHVEHLSELGIIDLANQTLRKKGMKYVMGLSKSGTSGG